MVSILFGIVPVGFCCLGFGILVSNLSKIVPVGGKKADLCASFPAASHLFNQASKNTKPCNFSYQILMQHFGSIYFQSCYFCCCCCLFSRTPPILRFPSSPVCSNSGPSFLPINCSDLMMVLVEKLGRIIEHERLRQSSRRSIEYLLRYFT